MIRLESLILLFVNAKLFRNVIRACAFWEMNAEAMHHAWVNLRSRNKIFPRSAQILFVIGIAVAMLVNARSSNHKADRDPKRLSERDSLLCELAQYLLPVS